jgi:prophage maintenance system killer protein
MNDDHNAAYVHEALRLQGYRLTADQEAAVATQFAGIAAIAAVLMREELDLALEPAPVFLP